jgi:WD40 repeat protein
LLSAGQDGCVLPWSVKAGCLGARPDPLGGKGNRNPVTALDCDDGVVVWGTSNGKVFLRRANSSVAEFCPHVTAVSALAIKGDLAMSGGEDGRLVVYRVEQGRILDVWRERSSVRGIAYCKPGFVYGLADGSVKYVCLTSPEKREIGRHPHSLRLLDCVDQEEETPRVVTAGKQAVHLWEVLKTGTVEVNGADQTHVVPVTAAATDGQLYVSGDSKGKVILRGLDRPRAWPAHHKDSVVKALRARGGRIVTGGKDGKVCVWQPVENNFHLLAVWCGPPVEVLWTDGQLVAWGGEGKLCWADVRTTYASYQVGQKLTALDGRKVGTGYQFLIASEGAGLVKLDTSSPNSLQDLEPDAGAAIGVSWLHADRNDWAAATPDRVLRRLNGREHGWSEGPASVTAFAARGPLLCWGTDKGALWCWAPNEASARRSATIHGNAVTAVVIAEDGLVVTGAQDGTVKVTDSNSDELAHSVGYPVGPTVTALDVAGRAIVVGLEDGGVVTLCHEPGQAPRQSGRNPV